MHKLQPPRQAFRSLNTRRRASRSGATSKGTQYGARTGPQGSVLGQSGSLPLTPTSLTWVALVWQS